MSYRLETLWVALGGLCLVVLYAREHRSRLTRSLLLGVAALAVLVSALGYFDDWRRQPPRAWLHEHDFFHYYFGARYFPELGYMRLYACTAAALRERAQARGEVSPIRFVRRLDAPGETLAGAALERAESECRGHFSAARWQAFRADIETLGARLPDWNAWQGTLADLGNNSPPTWNLYATLLANGVPLTARALDGWPLVDQLLLFVLVPLVVGRTLGLRALLVYGLAYCASPLAFLGWTGGSFGRADWYVALVCGLCALARGRLRWAAVLLAFASACRVFPVLFMVVVPLCLYLRGERAQVWRFTLTAAFALTLMLVAATLMFGLQVWNEFASVMQLRISPYGANTIGLHKLAACWNVIAWPHFAGDGAALRDATEWLQTLAGDSARRAGVSTLIAVALGGGTALLVRGAAPLFAVAWCGLVLLYVVLTPFTYYYAVLALLPLAITTLDGRLRAVLLALALLTVLALRAVSVPFAAELGRSPGFYAVSLLSSQVLLAGFAAMLGAWAATALLRTSATARLGPATALACALLVLLLAALGYRPVPLELAHYHDLSTLGALTASRGVSVRERAATASWPGAHFFEIALADGEQRLLGKLGGVRPGRYRVSVMGGAAPGYGRARLRLGGRQLIIDSRRDDGLALPVRVSLGDVQLDADSRYELEALDAAGARIGLSGLVLEPLPSS